MFYFLKGKTKGYSFLKGKTKGYIQAEQYFPERLWSPLHALKRRKVWLDTALSNLQWPHQLLAGSLQWMISGGAFLLQLLCDSAMLKIVFCSRVFVLSKSVIVFCLSVVVSMEIKRRHYFWRDLHTSDRLRPHLIISTKLFWGFLLYRSKLQCTLSWVARLFWFGIFFWILVHCCRMISASCFFSAV